MMAIRSDDDSAKTVSRFLWFREHFAIGFTPFDQHSFDGGDCKTNDIIALKLSAAAREYISVL